MPTDPKNNELCCQVNPIQKCRECNTGMCADHTKEGRTALNLFWCLSCSAQLGDCLDLIEDLAGRVDGLVESCEEAVDHIDTVADHTLRCHTCRSGDACNDLYSVIEQASRRADNISRTVRKLR